MKQDTRDDSGMNMASFLVDAKNQGLPFEAVLIQVREKFTPHAVLNGMDHLSPLTSLEGVYNSLPVSAPAMTA